MIVERKAGVGTEKFISTEFSGGNIFCPA